MLWLSPPLLPIGIVEYASCIGGVAAIGVGRVDERIVRAIIILEQRIGDEIDHASVAAAVGLSRYRLHHLFLEETGETPGGFLRRIRLDLAAMRLRWTRETVGKVAHGLGYSSQTAFNRAFIARFGATPARFRRDFVRWPIAPTDAIVDKRITLRERDGLTCLVRRYFGPYANVPDHWSDFLARLPADMKAPARTLFLGLTYDDPRFTPDEQIRYDCCVTIGRLAGDTAPDVHGLRSLVTRPGLYAAVEHKGSYLSGIGNSYSLILDNWAASNPRYTMADDPAIEVYATPPGQCAPEELACTILVPLN